MIYFTRHGESVANVADRSLQARPDDADRLSERGWEQARGVGERLRGEGIDGPVRAVFIRAPWLAEYGDAVEILAAVDGHPVAARQDNMLVISFHPEIAGETRVHELFLRDVR